jgi:hypothetical protein
MFAMRTTVALLLAALLAPSVILAQAPDFETLERARTPGRATGENAFRGMGTPTFKLAVRLFEAQFPPANVAAGEWQTTGDGKNWIEFTVRFFPDGTDDFGRTEPEIQTIRVMVDRDLKPVRAKFVPVTRAVRRSAATMPNVGGGQYE